MYLDKIVETKRQEVQKLTDRLTRMEVERQIGLLPPTRGFHQALSVRNKRELGLIAEVKKASPSKGLIRPDFNPVEIARSYESAAADCISVLTDETYFQGSGSYLQQIRDHVKLPLLRKDFIIDEMQIYEARLLGADAILLIAAILDDEQLRRFMRTAAALDLDVLLEVHDRNEMERALSLGNAQLIGINNRNLHTFETRLEVTAELSSMVPEEVTLISESGIRTPEDVKFLAQTGAKGLLIGETFMRQPRVDQAVNELMGVLEQDGVGAVLRKERS
ncbi:indole-3-glycerol phosphate synthase TrpC [Paenibacillus motobuensis]|uniref:indole-3-glycerol phosphate synthase TrpC n=1 Tax=Paenibacillus TaxID=44249 RepID=UPI00203F2869|nr:MULTISPECIES: indole-3-glycerol phosphate synthase TrpC [Paenibacillus]MCM3040143.1 indole-3-glycerol phosphate synthase TrpC [Paenibacillus lutimineralis]MCM3647247.1 indole-3-glycerol phosphate synthase TrpC [Paenibacillus motobuensis]